jgi:hypothetical protein
VGGTQVGLLKADSCWVATVDEGQQVRKPSSEAILIPLEQVRDECERID